MSANVSESESGNLKNEFRTVGKVKDAHGLKGELYVVLFAGEAAWLKQLKTLRLRKNEAATEALELTVKSARVHKGGLIVTTQELKDRNASEALKGYVLDIPSSFLVSNKGEDLYLSEIDGFTVHIKGREDTGRIVGFSSNTAQDLLIVEMKHGTFEIPFVKAFVESMNHGAREMTLDLPLGLLGEAADETNEDEIQ